MPTVTLRFRKQERELEVPEGANLLLTALDAGLDMRHGCTDGTCGKCVCRVISGADNLSRPVTAELMRLGRELIKNNGFRLACQVTVHGEAEIEQR